MAVLAEASLSDEERRVLERWVELMRERLGATLKSVWLYGSRARRERPGPESDIDVLVVTEGGRADSLLAIRLVDQAAEDLGLWRPPVSITNYTPQWLHQRREIESFFIQEVDRDKIVLHGGG